MVVESVTTQAHEVEGEMPKVASTSGVDSGKQLAKTLADGVTPAVTFKISHS